MRNNNLGYLINKKLANITTLLIVGIYFISCASTNKVNEAYESPYTGIQYTAPRERLNLRTFDERLKKIPKLIDDYLFTDSSKIFDDILDLADDINDDWDDLISCYRKNPDLKIELEHRMPFMGPIKELVQIKNRRSSASRRSILNSFFTAYNSFSTDTGPQFSSRNQMR